MMDVGDLDAPMIDTDKLRQYLCALVQDILAGDAVPSGEDEYGLVYSIPTSTIESNDGFAVKLDYLAKPGHVTFSLVPYVEPVDLPQPAREEIEEQLREAFSKPIR